MPRDIEDALDTFKHWRAFYDRSRVNEKLSKEVRERHEIRFEMLDDVIKYIEGVV